MRVCCEPLFTHAFVGVVLDSWLVRCTVLRPGAFTVEFTECRRTRRDVMDVCFCSVEPFAFIAPQHNVAEPVCLSVRSR